MNKKFIVISMLILLFGVGLIGGTKIITDKNDYGIEKFLENSDNRRPEIQYVGYEEDENEHRIIISIKNTWKKIVTVHDIQLYFGNKIGGYINFPIRGREDYAYKEEGEDSELGIDPGKTVEYSFSIPKEVYFDDKLVDFDSMRIEWNIRDWTFRVSDRQLLGGFSSWGASTELKNTGKPFSITGN